MTSWHRVMCHRLFAPLRGPCPCVVCCLEGNCQFAIKFRSLLLSPGPLLCQLDGTTRTNQTRTTLTSVHARGCEKRKLGAGNEIRSDPFHSNVSETDFLEGQTYQPKARGHHQINTQLVDGRASVKKVWAQTTTLCVNTLPHSISMTLSPKEQKPRNK